MFPIRQQVNWFAGEVSGKESPRMRNVTRTLHGAIFVCLLELHLGASATLALEQRNEVSYVRGPYNVAFFFRHNETFRNGAAIHFAHGVQHDILELTPLADAATEDAKTRQRYEDFLLRHRARTEPSMEYYGPYVARAMWRLYRAIDWTHMHHEQTYDILSDRGIEWRDKKRWTDRSVREYLDRNPVARSPAPLDVTMRRAAVMMKPYFGYFRNRYPQSNNFFFAAHWWHPAIYEAQMLGGNGDAQDRMVSATDETFYREVLRSPPERMLLSREMMPRYSRLSPESANIFDNLHMLHGIAYDILAYEGWTIEEKRAEMYRVIEAMSRQPGDDELAALFPVPRTEVDPRSYEGWMRSLDGEMTRIMMEMHDEMMPLMKPPGTDMSPEQKRSMQKILRDKLTPGMQPGEPEGSLHDAMMRVMPNMRMDEEGMKPGRAPHRMVETMLDGWRRKHAASDPVQPTNVLAPASMERREPATP
jgi:hypothetical protein